AGYDDGAPGVVDLLHGEVVGPGELGDPFGLGGIGAIARGEVVFGKPWAPACRRGPGVVRDGGRAPPGEGAGAGRAPGRAGPGGGRDRDGDGLVRVGGPSDGGCCRRPPLAAGQACVVAGDLGALGGTAPWWHGSSARISTPPSGRGPRAIRLPGPRQCISPPLA